MTLLPINTTINGTLATGLEVRVIMENLYGEAVIKVYYAYYSPDPVFLANGNMVLTTVMSEESTVNLRNALSNTLDVVPEMAQLKIWQLGNDYRFGYRIAGGEDEEITLTGTYITEEDRDAIEAEIRTTLNLPEPMNINFPFTLPLILA